MWIIETLALNIYRVLGITIGCKCGKFRGHQWLTIYRIDYNNTEREDNDGNESGLSDVEIVVIVLSSVIGAILMVVLCVCYPKRGGVKKGYNGIPTDMTKSTGNKTTKCDALEWMKKLIII